MHVYNLMTDNFNPYFMKRMAMECIRLTTVMCVWQFSSRLEWETVRV